MWTCTIIFLDIHLILWLKIHRCTWELKCILLNIQDMLYNLHYQIKIKINFLTQIKSNNYNLLNHNMLLQIQTIILLLSYTRILLINLSSCQILLSNLLMVSNTTPCNYNNYNSKCNTSNTTINKCSCKIKLLSLKKFSRMEL